MIPHVCTGASCGICLDELLLDTVFEPKEAAMGAALDRAAEGLAILAEADEEIARAQANGTDYYELYVNDPTRGWKAS